jgi:hypothetical protein
MVYGRVSSHTPPSNFEGDGGLLPFQPGARVVEVKRESCSTWVQTKAGIEHLSFVALDRSHQRGVRRMEARKRMSLIAGATVFISLAAWYVFQPYSFE